MDHVEVSRLSPLASATPKASMSLLEYFKLALPSQTLSGQK